MLRCDAAGLPDFVILGAQKSASTFLQDQMNQHPSVEIAAGEARHFEDPQYAHGAVDQLPMLFASRGAGTARGIKRPDYLGRPEVAERIAAHLPRARLFVVLRDPVPRAISSYYHYVRHGFAPLMPLDDAFKQLLDGRLTQRFPRCADVLEYGLYGQHIARYLGYFPASQLMVLDQGILVSRPSDVIGEAFEFVGVASDFIPQQGNTLNKGVYSPTRLRILRSKNRLQFRYSENRERRYPVQPGGLGYIWVGSVVGLDRMVLSKLDRKQPPSLSEELVMRLRGYYAEDSKRLRDLDLLGKGFGWLSSV